MLSHIMVDSLYLNLEFTVLLRHLQVAYSGLFYLIVKSHNLIIELPFAPFLILLPSFYHSKYQNIIKLIVLFMRASMNLNDLMISLSGKTEARLGVTTTVKEQVDDIEVTIDHFKKSMQVQGKQQSQLQIQLKKLQENTRTNFEQLRKQIRERVNYLSEVFQSDSSGQNKQFEYLELQNKNLHDQHDHLNDLTYNIMERTEETQNNVGL